MSCRTAAAREPPGLLTQVLDPETGEVDPDSPGVIDKRGNPGRAQQGVSIGRSPDVVDAGGERVVGTFEGRRRRSTTGPPGTRWPCSTPALSACCLPRLTLCSTLRGRAESPEGVDVAVDGIAPQAAFGWRELRGGTRQAASFPSTWITATTSLGPAGPRGHAPAPGRTARQPLTSLHASRGCGSRGRGGGPRAGGRSRRCRTRRDLLYLGRHRVRQPRGPGTRRAAPPARRHAVVSRVEHAAVRESARGVWSRRASRYPGLRWVPTGW